MTEPSMTEPKLTRSLLTLFTTPEKAEEIEGDLIEQAHTHSRLWLWIQLVQICFALAVTAFRRESVYTLLLSYGIYELCLKINYWMVQPLRRYVLRDTSLSRDMLAASTWLCWSLSGYAIGIAIAWFLPKFAVRATLGAASLILARVVILDGSVSITQIALFAIAPLLAGCFHMHHMRLTRSFRFRPA